MPFDDWDDPIQTTTIEASHPRMVSAMEASHFGPMEENGGYPQGFLDHLYDRMGVTDPDKVLHLCSGSIKRGVTVDIRPEAGAKYVCDARHTPFMDMTFDWILADPPPMEIVHMGLYGLPGDKFPKPEELLLEAERLLTAKGKVCILSMVVPGTPPYLELVDAFLPLMGPGFYVRGAFIYQRTGPDDGA